MTLWMRKEGLGETDLLKQEVCEHVLIFLMREGGEEVGRDTWGGGDGIGRHHPSCLESPSTLKLWA